MSPYREPGMVEPEPKVPWVVRAWRAVFGRKVYGGPETCGHCKFWKPPKLLRNWYYEDGKKIWYDVKGDCKLLFGTEDKTQYGECDRFRPKRRYMHRVRG